MVIGKLRQRFWEWHWTVAGRSAEALAEWASFETAAHAQMQNWDSANIELIYYYADHANRPSEALAVARQEAARRQDGRTLEAFAWALHRNGQFTAARKEMDKVLAVGVSHPATFARAAAIAADQRDVTKAGEYARKSMNMCGASSSADMARGVLAAIAETR